MWDVSTSDQFAEIWRKGEGGNKAYLSTISALLCCLHSSCRLSVFLRPKFTDVVMWQVYWFYLFISTPAPTRIIEPRAGPIFSSQSLFHHFASRSVIHSSLSPSHLYSNRSLHCKSDRGSHLKTSKQHGNTCYSGPEPHSAPSCLAFRSGLESLSRNTVAANRVDMEKKKKAWSPHQTCI